MANPPQERRPQNAVWHGKIPPLKRKGRSLEDGGTGPVPGSERGKLRGTQVQSVSLGPLPPGGDYKREIEKSQSRFLVFSFSQNDFALAPTLPLGPGISGEGLPSLEGLSEGGSGRFQPDLEVGVGQRDNPAT